MPGIEIDEYRCKGCGLCALACAKKLIIMSDKINSQGYAPAICNSLSNCTGCALCAQMCPDMAIKVFKE